MRKNIVCMLLACVLLATSVCAFAEQTDSAAVPSITIAQIVVPADATVTYADDFVVYVTPVAEETAEAKVFEEIAAYVQTETVATYFDEEAMTAAVELLPEEFDTETLVMDEFFPLKEQGYVSEYGAVEATFAFATEYEDDTVLLAVVGILPNEEELAAMEAEATAAPSASPSAEPEAEEEEKSLITWIPLKAEVVEGKVKITFTEEVLSLLADHDAVLTLLRGEAVVTEE